MSTPKRFKRDSTMLEQLPNELLVEVFRYLAGVDAVYAFCELNDRFRNLLLKYVNGFDFKSTSKAKFDYILAHHRVSDWRSLRLSDDDETPGQIKLFFQLYPPQQHRTQLQTLALLHMKPPAATHFLAQLPSFDQLVSLTIGDVCGETIPSCSLPSLQRLAVTGCGSTRWLLDFPQLNSLEYTITPDCCHSQSLTLPTKLKQLTLFYHTGEHGDALRTSLSQCNQLTALTLYGHEKCGLLLNGRTWEDLIESSFPSLQTFRFCFSFRLVTVAPDAPREMLDSFSSPFYVLEKRWFIQCDLANVRYLEGVLYTLPFAFTQMPATVSSFDMSFSTSMNSDIEDTKRDSFAQVNTLLVNDDKNQMPMQRFLSSNIVRMVVSTRFPSSWSISLPNLRHLELRQAANIPANLFFELLTNAPQLQSLVSPIVALYQLTEKLSNEPVCRLLSERIQSLRIVNSYGDGNQLSIVSVRQLAGLVRLFSKSCRHLSMGVAAHPTTILPILRRMRQLRSLHIQYESWRLKTTSNRASLLEQPPTVVQTCDLVHVEEEQHYYIWFGNRC